MHSCDQLFESNSKKEYGILGMRWQCVICDDYNLCTDCYMSDEHDLDHPFIRFDTPSSDGYMEIKFLPFTV
jgi:hypothetical protein